MIGKLCVVGVLFMVEECMIYWIDKRFVCMEYIDEIDIFEFCEIFIYK